MDSHALTSSSSAPPSYDVAINQSREGTPFRVARKPLRDATGDPQRIGTQPIARRPVAREGDATEYSPDQNVRANVDARPGLALDTSLPPRYTISPLHDSPAYTETSISTPPTSLSSASSSTSIPLSTVSSASTVQSTVSSVSNHVQTAYREARHFAGGLVTHPYESTKHYTLLRHSHGLVFYQGLGTTLAVSIFSNGPLPEERTIWLQRKGWSGRTGMRAKAFMGANGSWHNVTPAMGIEATQLKPTDERAWQRDIAHFQKKAKVYIQKNHILRETAVVRIPAEARDGYFQMVLCIGDRKKVLCPSPTFRILSTSASPHILRGASFRTLPLELGAMALGTYSRTTASAAVTPVTSTVQSRVQKFMPSWWVQDAVTASYGSSGAADMVNATLANANGRYDQVRDADLTAVGQVELRVDNGPQDPYPLYFEAQAQLAFDEHEQYSMPSLSLTSIPSDLDNRLAGYYFGWARCFRQTGPGIEQAETEYIWHQAILSALPLDSSQIVNASINKASRKSFQVRLLRNHDSDFDLQYNFEMHIMGFIRPDEPIQRLALLKGLRNRDEAAQEAAMLAEVNDVSMAFTVLGQPNWSVESAFAILDSRSERPKGLERVISGYAGSRMAAQKRIERPLHRFGVRMPSDTMQNKAMLVNGFYVRR